MKTSRFVLAALIVLLLVSNLKGSGLFAVCAIVEKVVFEPSESAPERVQVWGAFTFGNSASSGNYLGVERGYLYFRLPAPSEGGTPAVVSTVKKEWMDLKSVAGTGQAIAFGNWRYTGAVKTDLRIRTESEQPASAAAYATNVGLVKLDSPSHAILIDELKQALKR